jgi:hypothetical protein
LAVQPVTAPLTPTVGDYSLLQGALGILSRCDASCASEVIDLLGTPLVAPAPDSFVPPIEAKAPDSFSPPIDAQAPESFTLPIDDLTLPNPEAPPPGPITYVDKPASGPSLSPLIPPQSLKSIPETPTWVMAVLGFSVMALVFGKGRRSRFNPISIVDVSEHL